MKSILLVLALAAIAYSQTTGGGAVGTSGAAAAGTTAASPAAGTTAAPAAGTTASPAAGTTAAAAAAGTTAAASPAGTTAAAAAAGTTAAPAAAGTTAAAAAATTAAIVYLPAGFTSVAFVTYNNSCSGVTLQTSSLVPHGICELFTALTIPGVTIYHVTKLSTTALWTSLYTTAACSASGTIPAIATFTLQNQYCGSFSVATSASTSVTVWAKATWTAGVGGTTAAAPATPPSPPASSASSVFVGLLPILMSLVAVVFFS